jgi:DNA/RNA-binding domain of Phe-tRNA-synthetase-like protein
MTGRPASTVTISRVPEVCASLSRRSPGRSPHRHSSTDGRGSLPASSVPVPPRGPRQRIVDAYNAVSVRYGLPIGGEDLDAYDGPARLVRADGGEPFDTVKNGEAVLEHPEPGEVIWRDAAGVTCRRWNWRQCTRTHITERTKNALFILERLEPCPLEHLTAAGAELAALMRAITPEVAIATRLVEP